MQAQFNNIYVADPLKLLQKLDANQFDLIYLDPPYFESNSYNKNDAKSPYQDFGEYLEYISGILLQSHRVLTNNGSVLLRIDPLSLFNARLFLDRIFGKQNFRAEVVWKRRIVNSSKNTRPRANFESVFFYSKTENFVYNLPVRTLSEEEIKKQYRHADSKGYYKLWPLFDNLSRPKGNFEWQGIKPTNGKSWRYTKDRLIELDQKGEIEKKGKSPQRKIYLDDSNRLIPLGFVWDEAQVFGRNDGQSDLRIQKVIEMASSTDAKILCLFSDLFTLNTIQRSNIENTFSRSWVGLTPIDIVSNLLQETQKKTPKWPNYLLDSRVDIQVNVLDFLHENTGIQIPEHIQRLINSESRSVSPNSLLRSTGQKFAFLVGINRYTKGIGDLHYCVNDATELGQIFQNHGYEVKMLYDDAEDISLVPNRANIVEELNLVVKSLNPEDTLYVHFSGHGEIIEDDSMIITSDTRRQRIKNTSLSVDEIIQTMNSGRAGKRILSLDICHGGAEMGRTLIDQEFIQNVYEKAEGFVLLAASTARQQAYETHEYKHGLFTYFLIQGLSGNADLNDDGIITVNDLKNYTLDQVRHWNAQNGGIQEPTFKAEGIGDIPLVMP